MSMDPTLKMSSRRTVCDGEVVTFATSFARGDFVFSGWMSLGPFEVSASREAIMVHTAKCRNTAELEMLVLALRAARIVLAELSPHQHGGMPSAYPSDPTDVASDPRFAELWREIAAKSG